MTVIARQTFKTLSLAAAWTILLFFTASTCCLYQFDVKETCNNRGKNPLPLPCLTASAVGSKIAVVRPGGPAGWLPVGFRQLAAPESSSARRLFALERLRFSRKEQFRKKGQVRKTEQLRDEQLRDQAPLEAPRLKPGFLAPENVLHENTLHENVLLKNILLGNALLEDTLPEDTLPEDALSARLWKPKTRGGGGQEIKRYRQRPPLRLPSRPPPASSRS